MWNPHLYQENHAFVWEHGHGVLEWLDPRPGERILDVGCGTGQLAAGVAETGAKVIGLDASDAMIDQARRNYPGLEFVTGDVRTMTYSREFDAVYSNAALHWVREADTAARAMAAALKPGGRLVVELGGQGNIASLLQVVYQALEEMGVANPAHLNPWHFPSIGAYCSQLESAGLTVRQAMLFPRPTPLDGGAGALARWFAMFGDAFTRELSEDSREQFLRLVEARAAHTLLRDGVWVVDYRRLRVFAVKE